MDAFDNLFDEALSHADTVILEKMGRWIFLRINGQWGAEPVRAVFDKPDVVSELPAGAARMNNVNASLFVKTADIQGLKKFDAVKIDSELYWVKHIEEDDIESSVVEIARGKPGKPQPEITSWSR